MELVPKSLCFRELRRIVREELVPSLFRLCALLRELGIMRVDIVRAIEALVGLRPAELFLERLDVLDAERLAMRAGLALLCRTAVADFCLDRDEGRMLLVRLCLLDGFANRFEVVAILDRDGLEAEGLHALLHVLTERDVRAALDGDAVAVIEDDELRKAERARKRERLGRDALHHAAVAAKRKRVVVNDVITRLVERRCEMRLGHRHADSHAHAGTERARRRLNADRVAVLRMARRQGIELAELLHIVHRQAVAIEMEQRIEKRRAMTARKDEAVAVRPLRILRVVVHVVRPEFIRHRRRAERQPRVAGIGLLDGIRRQHADGVDAFRINVAQ